MASYKLVRRNSCFRMVSRSTSTNYTTSNRDRTIFGSWHTRDRAQRSRRKWYGWSWIIWTLREAAKNHCTIVHHFSSASIAGANFNDFQSNSFIFHFFQSMRLDRREEFEWNFRWIPKRSGETCGAEEILCPFIRDHIGDGITASNKNTFANLVAAAKCEASRSQNYLCRPQSQRRRCLVLSS